MSFRHCSDIVERRYVIIRFNAEKDHSQELYISTTGSKQSNSRKLDDEGLQQPTAFINSRFLSSNHFFISTIIKFKIGKYTVVLYC